jgi:hypothetical protein
MVKVVREYVPSVHYQRRIPLSKDERENREQAFGSLKKTPSEVVPFPTRYTMNKDERVIASNKLGPYTKQTTVLYNGRTERKFDKWSQWYRSKTKVRIQPNAYQMRNSWVNKLLPASGAGYDCVNSWAGDAIGAGKSVPDGLASNKAMSRFVDRCRDKTSSSLGTTLAEWRQSEQMIVLRAGQILSALKALKTGNAKKFERALGISISVTESRASGKSFRGRWAEGRNRFRDEKVPFPDRVRQWSKDLSNLWLEYHFGWAPLLDDIHKACDVLKSNPPSQRVTATGRATTSEKVIAGKYAWSTDATYEVHCKVGAEVYISNGNLALANQLGLVNPASVAWEVVPFSFLVDWFLPVGKFLESWTDLLGYTTRYPYYTFYRQAKSLQEYKQDSSSLGAECQAVGMVRTLGLPPFRFVRPPFNGFSVARGATAISLVIQQFLSISGSPSYRWSH